MIFRPLAVIAALLLAACAPAATPTITPSLVPTASSTPQPTSTRVEPEATATLEVTAAPTPIIVTLPAVTGEELPPPLDIALPEGWQYGYNVLALNDVDAIQAVPVAVYTGPVTGGTGTIVLLWGFPNITAGNPLMPDSGQVDLWVDGLRLLRLAVVEQGCNIGTDLRQTYRIGSQEAVGTQFAAVDCPELADTRGWFAGLQHENLNFVFFVYTEPIDALNPGRDALQSILDSVQFRPLS